MAIAHEVEMLGWPGRTLQEGTGWTWSSDYAMPRRKTPLTPVCLCFTKTTAKRWCEGHPQPDKLRGECPLKT